MSHAVYRFGDFTVDTGAHVLLKNGARLAIQEQPLQVLLALLENPGQVLTREALRVRLWGTDTFVDFDQSLNSALRRLRLALDDNSREPTYVETIPRVGFRFLADVTVEAVGPEKILQSAPPATSVPPTVVVPAPEARTGRFPGVAGAVATLTFIFGVLLGVLPAQWRRVSEPDQVSASSRDLEEPVAHENSSPLDLPTAPVTHEVSTLATNDPARMTELEGWYHLKQRTQQDYVQAKADFEQTLAAGQSSSALVGLGQTEILLALNGDAPHARLQHARRVGQQALTLSPHSASAHTIIGAADALADWNDAEAEQEFHTALHLEPHNSLSHLWYAVFVLLPRREYREAEAEADTAISEDPLSLIAHTDLGWILYSEGKKQAALDQYRFVLRLNPQFVPAQFRVNQLLLAEGRPDPTLDKVAALRGARDAHADIPQNPEDNWADCGHLPISDAQNSQDPQALSALRKGVQEHCPELYFLGQDPELAKMRKNPELAQLLKSAHSAHPLQ